MTFDEVIEAFMSNVETGKAGGTSVTYKRKIYVFQEYVNLRLQAKDVNFQSILTAMTKEQLVESLQYYVMTYDIKYVATVETYITVIGVFFDFIASSITFFISSFIACSFNRIPFVIILIFPPFFIVLL